MKVNKGV
jgi:hypothetical protein